MENKETMELMGGVWEVTGEEYGGGTVSESYLDTGMCDTRA